MNVGLLAHSARRLDVPTLRLRCALKLVQSSNPSAGTAYGSATFRYAYNIERVTYNAAGDVTITFGEGMPSNNYIVQGCAKQAGGIEYVVNVHQSDAGLANSVRLIITSAAGGGANNVDELHVLVFA